MSNSQVQQLREQIDQEIESMRRGLHGVAVGVAKHQCIEARMHRIGQYEDQLAEHIGKQQAALFTCQTYIQRMKDE